MTSPQDHQIFSGQTVHIDATSTADEGIDHLEIWVDNSKAQTVTDHKYAGDLNLATGQHEIYIKAFSSSGRSATTSTAHIGTGGADWQKPNPSPSPSPSPSASPIVPLPSP